MANRKQKKVVDFRKIKMESKTKMWTDEMGESLFIQAGRVNSTPEISIEPLKVNTKKTSIRNSPFANKFR